MYNKISEYLKYQRQFWDYAKNQPFFGLKLKYAIWILLLGYSSALFAILWFFWNLLFVL